MNKQAKEFGKQLERAEYEWRLRSIREGHGERTSADFAEWIGVRANTYSSHKKGHFLPDSGTLDLYAARLGPVVYTWAGKPARMPNDPLLRRIAETWPNLPDAIKERAAEFVEDEARKHQGQQEDGKDAGTLSQMALL